MIVAVMVGQRTPGHSTAEAVSFERRINQRYVDHIAPAGWNYLGVYAVEGLVAGAFGEVIPVDAADPAEAFRRDAENETALPEDVAAFYAQCNALFWQRGVIRFWVEPPADWRVPQRGEAVRVTVCEPEDSGALVAVPWRDGEVIPVPAVRIEVIGTPPVQEPTDEPLDMDCPPLPLRPAVGTELIFLPLAPAPRTSAGVAAPFSPRR